eukprot:CAMPEP_0179481698 /NCGR_PEP_ID=MMETSP0799-20121207/59364_1 /TAXON_ID=46947 /ORGANISM="Geminigera cryophila, Strain CCMP2564" /LENGTH=133 /DNA_ID=CAMNT_0021294441 /DNA_START=62 /DNA_END=460 /DNA_ORIENTATION=+
MPAAVAVEEEEEVIVGKRAEGRSAKKCESVLCAHRQMLYGMREEWSAHRSMCHQQWHFNVSENEIKNKSGSPSPNNNGKLRNEHVGSSYVIKGKEVTVTEVLSQLVRVVCATLLDAAAPGGVLQVGEGEEAEW